jgi:hypothetical protein
VFLAQFYLRVENCTLSCFGNESIAAFSFLTRFAFHFMGPLLTTSFSYWNLLILLFFYAVLFYSFGLITLCLNRLVKVLIAR